VQDDRPGLKTHIKLLSGWQISRPRPAPKNSTHTGRWKIHETPANVKETSWPIKIHSNQTMFKTLSALREQRIAAKLVLRSRKAGSRLMVNA